MRINLEDNNLREIDGLSQRGRTLSIVDLINANTLDVDMAAYSLYAMSNGASFLTAARPGNAGKSTLIACLMTLMPPGIKVITSDSSVITEAQRHIDAEGAENVCFLCHEIGAASIRGYIWGKHVEQFLHFMSSGCRIASCIHADTLPEMRGIMVSKELGVSEEDFARLGLIFFLKLERSPTGHTRRVATLYEPGEAEEHNLLFSWEPKSDTFSKHGKPMLLERIARQNGQSVEQAAEKLQQCKLFIQNLMQSGETDFRWVRKQVVGFYDEL